MKHQHLFRKISMGQGVVVCALAAMFAALPSSAQENGLFTDAQARRGQAVYDKKCGSCHGIQLEGGSASPLAGGRFAGKWANGSHNVDELFYIVRTQMPYGAGGTLKEQEYIDIVAYMLKANGYRAGARELPAASAALKQLRIEPRAGGAKPPAASEEPKPAASGGALSPSSTAPTQEELNAAGANTADWLMSNHDYGGQRFVSLKQITPQNAGNLRPVCMYQAGDTKTFHTNPVVYKGVMFLTTAWSTIAIDATNCQLRWRHDWKPKSIEVHPPNRGVAIKDGRVIRATTDGYLFALDLASGKLLWEKRIIEANKGEGSFNMAPVVFENLAILGLGISEMGVKCWVAAFRIDTGEEVWRFHTVPNDGEPGAETWGPGDSRLHGGGAVWAPMSLDPADGTVFIPVGNPAPDFYADRRPGANLYTGSMIALDARTGKLKWYRQLVGHDTHDWDTTQASPLFNATVNGKMRKLVAILGKDGLMHVVDRETHEQVYETPVTTRLNAEVETTVEGVRTCPGVLGGVLWNGPAFNPGTNMLYVPAVDWCGVFKKAQDSRYVAGQAYMGGIYLEDPVEKSRGWLTAVDASTGKVAWKYESSRPMLAAVTTTAGGVVFTGEVAGDFLALDARTGKVLYRFPMGGPMNAGVISYAINGQQFVAAATGAASGFWKARPGASAIVVFALPR